MSTLNLSGRYVQGHEQNHPVESFLRPHSDRMLDVQVHPNTKVEAGMSTFFRFDSKGQPIMQTVKEVHERRKCKGDWSKRDVHLDWARLELAN